MTARSLPPPLKPWSFRTVVRGGETWVLHPNGFIERPGRVAPSKSWYVISAAQYNNFGVQTGFYTLDDIMRGGIVWKHANGKQRVFVNDVDHGSQREWRDYHSIF